MSTAAQIIEEIEISGHIIDSLILPKVLDTITANGGKFRIAKIAIGQSRHDPSNAVIEVQADTPQRMQTILAQIADHGAVPTTKRDCHLVAADMDGAFPEGFYSTTNQRTEIRLDGKWTPVADQEMDCGIVVEAGSVERGAEGKSVASSSAGLAPRSSLLTPRCIPMTEIRRGMPVVCGHMGVRVIPVERTNVRSDFTFMSSGVSTEKPKTALMQEIARDLVKNRRGGGKTLIVGGPAIVHTGSGPTICQLIRGGYVNKLFAGNALATHDIEQSFFGTSLGISMDKGLPTEEGHEHHLRAINKIRRAGGIKPAVEKGILKSGIMHDCVTHNIPYVLGGSVRDDGPLTDVITDTIQAQELMRKHVRNNVGFCLMVATALHSIATGNLLPAWVKVACIDINPATVTKLMDRGSTQTVGIVTDVEPFLRELVTELRKDVGI